MSRSDRAGMDGIVMDADYMDRHDVIQRYIRHALSTAELDAFEVLLLADASLIDQVELQKLINEAFRKELSPRAVARTAVNWPVWTRRIAALAACLVLSFYVALQSPRMVDSLTAMPSMPELRLENLRGPSVLHDIRLSSLPAQNMLSSMVRVPLEIDVGPQLDDVFRYRVKVWQPSTGQVLVEANTLSATNDGWLNYDMLVAQGLRGQFQVDVSEIGSRDLQTYQLIFQ